ncbi:MAG: SIMPL domain-containing protein [Candidatus Dadabacteria bacterium]
MGRIPVLILLCVTVISCTTSEKTNKIRVAGEGKIRVMPDQVNLTIDISFTNSRMVDAVRQTQATVDSVMNILQKFGKKQQDIKTSSISANKSYTYVGNTQKFVGYQATQSIDFLLHDISQFTELTGRLLETKITSISQIQFGHSRADSLFREADLLAYDDALKSATKLANRANVKLGKVIFVSNDNPSPDNGYYNENSINTYNKGYGGRGFKISPEVLEFRRIITTEYEISG